MAAVLNIPDDFNNSVRASNEFYANKDGGRIEEKKRLKRGLSP
jgi:hypothetical protein